MSDLIRIVDLEVSSHIGVPDEERAQAQKLLISLEMSVDSFCQAAATDDLSLTVDYFDVTQRVKHFTAERPRKLLETLAEEIAADLLEELSRSKNSRWRLKSLSCPMRSHVSVEIERKGR